MTTPTADELAEGLTDTLPRPDGATSEQLVELGLTYRQLDYWTRRGYLHATRRRESSGIARAYSPTEVAVAHLMHRLVVAGIIPAIAALAARTLVEGNTRTTLLGPGLHLVVDDMSAPTRSVSETETASGSVSDSHSTDPRAVPVTSTEDPSDDDRHHRDRDGDADPVG